MGWQSYKTGRWCGLGRNERICKNCYAGSWMMLSCTCMDEEGKQMEKLMEETVDGWHEMEDKEVVVVMVVDEDCDSAGMRRSGGKLYRRRFAGN